MICPTCSELADIVAAIRVNEGPPNAAAAELATTKHKQRCKGGTWCDCQHVVRPS